MYNADLGSMAVMAALSLFAPILIFAFISIVAAILLIIIVLLVRHHDKKQKLKTEKEKIEN